MRLVTRLSLSFLLTVPALSGSAGGDDIDPGPPDATAGDADYTRATPAQRHAALDAARRQSLDALRWQYHWETSSNNNGCPVVDRDYPEVTATADGCVDSDGRTFRGGYRLLPGDKGIWPLYYLRLADAPYDIDARFEDFEVDDPEYGHRWFDGTMRLTRPERGGVATTTVDLTTRHLNALEPVEVHVAATWRAVGLNANGRGDEQAEAGGVVDVPGIGSGFIEGSWRRVNADLTTLGTVSLRGQNLMTLRQDGACAVITIDGDEVERTCP